MGLRDWLSALGLRRKAEVDVAALRAEFAARYHHFKLFLNANNAVHELMTDIEEGLRGVRPFGMHFVRAVCTRLSTSTFQLIKHLDELAPGKYAELYARFAEIQKSINPHVFPDRPRPTGPLVMRLREVGREHVDLVGPKMANLGEIKNRLGVTIPRGFVITAEAYRRFMAESELQEEIDRRFQSAEVASTEDIFNLSSSIQQLIVSAPLPREVEEAILLAFDTLKQTEAAPDLHVAMRSSALAEDLAEASFAGQYRSKLNVGGDELIPAYKLIVASKYSLQAIAYRLHRGIREEDVAMCVGCMAMVDAVCGGVAYSRNPLNSHDDAVQIHAAWGLPKAVLDGSAEVDVYQVSRTPPHAVLRREIAEKKTRYACLPEGTCRMEVTGAQAQEPCLDEAQAVELARLALSLEEFYGAAQDMEWALAPDGGMTVLQCRPLTSSDDVLGAEEVVPEDARYGTVLLKGGTEASPGVGAGPVYHVRKDADVLAFPRGAVLVVSQALPRWAALLNRAAALVSEQGGLAGHLANVAREFGKPAIMGLRGACEALESGRVVTVDAGGHTVYDGRVEALLAHARRPKNLMLGSPVYSALEEAARHILPLNLLDPADPSFRARNCRTLHDITRYSHEKAVWEMFRFGTEHDFPQAAAKQLVCDVRKQFWVVNLDDGFNTEVLEPFVRVEQIASIPMLALWKGMNVVPWEGPPPVHTSGFLSVMFEATANPELEPATQAEFAMKSYFMISKNYVSLQSRFGFHFCAVEGLVSERASENYIAFQFKGGAANMERRVLRARFVADLLQEFDFSIRLREDSVTARLENREQAFMEHRMRVLGYLVIHTRQLDMAMTDAAAIAERRERMLRDISTLL
jgi:pyruvate,water dikinase